MRPVLVGAIAAALIASGIPTSGYAAVQTNSAVIAPVAETVTLDSAIQKATDYSMQIRQIANAKNSAMKAYSATENGGAKAAALLDQYNVYQGLYQNGAKDALQVMTLEMYQAMFGPQPNLSFEQMYDQFVIPSEITPYQVYVQFQGLKIDEPTVISTVAYQTKQLYYGILSYQHSVALMKDSATITEKKIKELELKYKLGQVAKATLESEKLSYSKSLLELEKQKKELNILEMQFKGLLGYHENTAIKLSDPGLIKATEIISYDALVSKALANRADLKKSQLTIDQLTHEVKVMSQYLRDEKLDRRVDADQRLLSAKLAKAELENQVRAEVLDAYNDYKQAQEQLLISEKKVALSEKQLSKMKQLLKVGYVKNLDVFGVELQLQNSKLSYESAVYNYNKQLDAVNRITMHALN